MVVISRNIFFLTVMLLCSHTLTAQQGLLQRVQLNDFYRIAQIGGKDTIHSSFSVGLYKVKSADALFAAKKDSFRLSSEFGYTLQSSSKLPYSYNDGTLYPASGFQQRVTAGLALETRYFSITIQPEWVAAANSVHNDLLPPASNTLNNYWGKYIAMMSNRIDMPSRFGDSSFSRLYPGQSSVKVKLSKFSAGVSTENLWWGPARYNALIMSNNAPGFFHATINTTEPVNTPIGSIEAQVVYGKLEGSGITPPEVEQISQIGCPQCYEPPVNHKNRNMGGYVFALSPRGLKNFYIGLAYASYSYADTALKASRLSSMFFRYAMPKDNAEIYAEYGRSDKHITPFDLFKDSVPYGYTIGFRKLVPLRKNDSYISIAAELSHLGLSKAKLIFDPNNVWGGPNPAAYSWYTSSTIRHGYTNHGQGMGAAIGTGSNSQTLNISWVNNQNQFGIQLQRVMRNTDFYYYYYFNGIIGLGNTAAFWTDISASLFAQWQFKNLMLAGSVDYLSSINYKWLKLDGTFEGPSSLSDKKNFQVRLSALYAIDWLGLKKK